MTEKENKDMRLIAITILIFSFFCSNACSSFDSPAKVVEKFYSYAEAGKVNDAYELLTKDGKEMLKKYGGGVSLLSDFTREIKQKGGIKSFEIKKEEITGDTAKVTIKLSFGNGTKKEDNEELVKEGHAWRIAVSK
jgi:hypothetical protein